MTATFANGKVLTVTYDAMGNPTTYRGKALTWRGKQLTGITAGTDVISYSYDENGLRLQKTVNNVATDYYYNGSVLIGLVKGNDTLRFSYDAAGNAAAVDHNGTYYYYLRNGQGDVVKIIDGSGNTVVEYTYDSWGKQLSCTGTLATTLGALNPFRYRGYVYDEETQWYYLKSRYYDPETCRFISADVYLSTGQGVLGHNCYAYCLNNPICRVDSFGKTSLVKPTLIIDPDYLEYHEKDQEMISQIKECMKKSKYSYQTWIASGSLEKRQAILQQFTNEVLEIMGVETAITLYYEYEVDYNGAFSSDFGAITLNGKYVWYYDIESYHQECFIVIIHECRHAYQYHFSQNNPNNSWARRYNKEMSEVSGKLITFEQYYSLIAEIDAYAFSNAFSGR